MSLRFFFALVASLLLHVAGGFALAAWTLQPPEPVLWIQAGRADGISLTMTLTLPHHAPPQPPVTESLPLHTEVTVTPLQARIAQQSFVITPSANVSPVEMLPTENTAPQVAAVLPGQKPTETERKLPGDGASTNSETAIARSHIQAEPPDTTTTVSLESLPAVATSSTPQSRPQGDEKTTAPDFAGNLPPVMPEEARRRGWSGEVLLRIHVDESGRVTKVELVRSSGHAILDAAAAAAIRTWKGTPARKNGRPIASSWRFPIHFGY